MSEGNQSIIVTRLLEALDQEYKENNPRDVKLIIEAEAEESGARRGTALSKYRDRNGNPVSSPFALLVDLVDSYRYCVTYTNDFRHTFESYKAFMENRPNAEHWTPTEIAHARDKILKLKRGVFEIYKKNCAVTLFPSKGLGTMPRLVEENIRKIPMDPQDIDPRDIRIRGAIEAAATITLKNIRMQKEFIDKWLGLKEDLSELVRAIKSKVV
jgi:hypothetical protein